MKTRGHILLGLVAILATCPCVAFAAPFAQWLDAHSPAGRSVRIWGEGDEYSASFEAEDGHAVVQDASSRFYYYARKDIASGALVRTDIPVGDESPDDKRTIADIPLHLRDTSQQAAEERARRIAIADEERGLSRRWEELKEQARSIRMSAKNRTGLRSPPSRPTLGNIVGLTLLVDFPITNAAGVVTNTLANTYHPNITKAHLEDLLNGENCTLFGNVSSVRKYYEDVSCGHMSYTNIVLGWFTAAHPREYYDDPTQDNGPCGRELIGEILSQIANDPQCTSTYMPLLRQVSYSGDYFRALNVWFAGPNAQTWSKGLWAHQSSLGSTFRQYLPVTVDGQTKYFNAYQITPITANPSIGTFCHENGHMVCGFPDLYDYAYGNGGPAGSYSLMNNSGSTNPIYVDAYLRAAAGWVEPKELPATPSLLQVANRRDDVWKYTNPFDSTQYYLIENRQKTGRDANLPGGGILIWRCDETGNNMYLVQQDGFAGAATNRVDAELSLEQADGLYELEQRIHTWDGNDLWFAGNSAASYSGTFSAFSTPCAKWRDASKAAIQLSSFSAKGQTMTFFSGDTGDLLDPLFVSQLESSGFQSLTFGVVATAFGRDANALLVYADVTADSVTHLETRTDYLGRISELGVKNTFTVSGLTVGKVFRVRLRVVQEGGAGAEFEGAEGSLHIDNVITIATAVDAPSIPFWHGEALYANDWDTTSGTSYTGGTCARSGARTVSDASESKSVLHAGVVGPGTLSFRWKADCENVRYDWLAFSHDGSTVTNKIGGTGNNWTLVSEHFDAGDHILAWTYRKDYSVNSGQDCGWIDAVQWTPDQTASPAAPTNLSATEGTLTSGVRLSWRAAANADRYAVFRSQSNVLNDAELVGMTTQCEYLDRTAATDTTFHYWVRAENEVGSSGFAGSVGGWWPSPLAVAAQTLSEGVVGTPFTGTLSATGGRQPYSWSLVEGTLLPNGLSLYSSGTISGTPISPYYGTVAFRVTDANGTVAEANVGLEIRSTAPPSVVSSFIVESDYGRLILSWEPQADAVSYVLYRSTTQVFENAIAFVRTWATSYIDNDIEEGVPYFYWVVAENESGTGPEGTCIVGASKVSPVTGDIYVHAATGNDSNGGESWKKAKRSIQAAVSAAAAGDRIVVAPGVYRPINTDNALLSIVSVEGPVATVIDGGGTIRCASLSTSSSGTNTFLCGFTLANGCAAGRGDVCGGGSVGGTLSRCIISNCITRSEDYSAYGGGACYGYLRNCLIVGNRTEAPDGRAYGGGCYLSNLYNCTVTGNRAETALSLSYADGAGVSYGNAYNTIVWDNELVTSEGTFRSPGANMTANVAVCAVRADPLFVDAANGDWRLASNSPCLEAGSPNYVSDMDALDLAGNPRMVEGAVDMGAFQGAVAATSAPTQATGVRARTDRDARGVSIRWHGVAGAGLYKVYRSGDQSADDAVEIGETTQTSFVDMAVGIGTTYWYRVIPCNGFGDAALDGAEAVAVTVEEDGADFYVDATSGNDTEDGKSWASAKRSIRAVTSLLDEGDLVLVKPGRYEPIVVGGIPCEIRSTDGADVTFLDGGGTNRCARLVIDTRLGSTDTILTGFSLIHGWSGESNTSNYGGGAYGGTLQWCVVSNCIVSSTGSREPAYGGGTFYTDAWNSKFVDNLAISASSSAYGGSAYTGYFYNCLFSGNQVVSEAASSEACGGAIAYGYSFCSTIVNNSARNTGGGYSQGGGACGYYHYDSIIWGNEAGFGNDIADINSGYYYCCISEPNQYCDGSTCITSTPTFVDAANGDWRLAAGSPCIDAGHNYYAYGEKDLQEAARIQETRVDMGAFEGAWTTGEQTVSPLEVETRFLPAAQVGQQYATVLRAAGGGGAYTWMEALAGYSESHPENSFAETGTAQEWQGDDNCWAVTLPFAFPFFRSSYSTMWVNSNGTLTFDGSFTGYIASTETLSTKAMVAVLWDDLYSLGGWGDIYVQSSADAVTIRWRGIYLRDPYPSVSFSATLYADGTIRLHYGAGNDEGGMIGISSGNGTDYILSSANQNGSMGNAADIMFEPIRTMPTGLSLSRGGVLSGSPATSGNLPISVVVTDGDGATAAATLSLVVAEATQTETSTTPVPVPYSWLDEYFAIFAPGADYETLAHTETGKRNADGSPMFLWQDYIAGTNPTNVNDVFTATIEMVGTTPVVHWKPDLNSNGLSQARSYTVWGKTNLLDRAWHSPTNEASRFFKVTVGMP